MSLILLSDDSEWIRSVSEMLDFVGVEGYTCAGSDAIELLKGAGGAGKVLMFAPDIDSTHIYALTQGNHYKGKLIACVDVKSPLIQMSELGILVLQSSLTFQALMPALDECGIRPSYKHNEEFQNHLTQVLVGNSPPMHRLRAMVEKAAVSDVNVILRGESGVGKEVVARAIHKLSSRANRPFVPVNCGAIPAELLESELFGHEKGAFTGAINMRKGRFEIAQGGTLFLDEIGEMPLPMQVKLLRVLQERSFERVGGNESHECDIRIIAATHRDLERAIDIGEFREDLYYRLNVFPIEIVPLRDRRSDIGELIHELSGRLRHANKPYIRLNNRALSSLRAYDWPGNIRELANLVERLAILVAGRKVDYEDLPPTYRIPTSINQNDSHDGVDSDNGDLLGDGIDLKSYIDALEYKYIQQALDHSGGVVAHAAQLLSLRRTTLVEKMRKYGMSSEHVRRHIDS